MPKGKGYTDPDVPKAKGYAEAAPKGYTEKAKGYAEAAAAPKGYTRSLSYSGNAYANDWHCYAIG